MCWGLSVAYFLLSSKMPKSEGANMAPILPGCPAGSQCALQSGYCTSTRTSSRRPSGEASPSLRDGVGGVRLLMCGLAMVAIVKLFVQGT